MLPAANELFIACVTSLVSSDCLVDRLEDWWSSVGPCSEQISTLVFKLGNRPACHSRRTQFIQCLVTLVDRIGLTIQLAYYPPYPSKYNPIKRGCGMLEQRWNGSLLDSLQGTLDMIETMIWRRVHPVMEAVTKRYYNRVQLTKDAIEALEQRLERHPTLDR